MTEPEHTFTARYRVVGRSLYEQLADWAEHEDAEPHDPAACPICIHLDAYSAEVLADLQVDE